MHRFAAKNTARGFALGLMAATFAPVQEAQAVDAKQCMQIWNVINGRVSASKESLSNSFKKSLKVAFFITDARGDLILDTKGTAVSNCDRRTNGFIRDIVVESRDDYAMWLRFQEIGSRLNLPISPGLKMTLSPNADPELRKLVASRIPEAAP